MANISLSGFSLAKAKELTGDDFYDMKELESSSVAVLCDGVGSADEGAEAAKRVCNFLVTNLKTRPSSWSIEKSIKHFISNINKILYTESMENYERVELVTTLTVVLIEGERLYGANVGDSRIYLLRDEKLHQLSHDHASEEEGMENVLTSAIGISENIDVYYFENIIKEDDKILLCSDGLYNVLDEKALIDGMKVSANYLVKSASKLMNDDLPDDTTAIIMNLNEIDQVCRLKALNLKIPEKIQEGENIDGYKLSKALVQNKRTWLCENRGKKYVLKYPPFEANEDPKLLDLFVKEAWNARRLKAGFFPKAVIPKNRTSRYYIMEYIDDNDIKNYLKKRLLSVDEGVKLADFLLNMSQYLLKYNLVHGDIKPENIIRAQRKGKTYYKMVDFGSIVEIFSLNSRAGTPSYLAPERFHGSMINEQSEIFAIGVTLYESLTGKFPYGEIEPFQTPTFKIPKRPTKLNPKIPLWLESIILRAISTDASLRYKNYSEMLYEVQNPENVKPFYDKSIPLLERNPLVTCKVGFALMLIVNFVLMYLLVR